MIDAHQHCWRIGANDCVWPGSDLPTIHRDFEVEELMALAKPLGVTGTVLVQSQESDVDTDYLLSLAREQEFIAAVVAWVDLASPTAPKRIAQLALQPKLRGLRPMLQSQPEDEWLLRPELVPAIETMLAYRLSFDALVFPRHLPYLKIFSERYPTLPVVIDHAAKPSIAAADAALFQEWCDAMTGLASLPQVHCKLSGLVTEASARQDVATLREYIDHLLRIFGPARLMWGSDWPVVNLAPNGRYAGYAEWFDLAQQLLSDLPAEQRQVIFDGNARRFYRIHHPVQIN